MTDPDAVSVEPLANPIINPPYAVPTRHFEIGPTGPTGTIIESRRPSESYIPVATVRKGRAKGADQSVQEVLTLTHEQVVKNTLIDELRGEVAVWRNRRYDGVTPISRKLLEHWADPDRDNRVLFAQREAAETAIFLAEVSGRKTSYGVIRDWRTELGEVNDEHNAGLPRVALKMATGSGKTVVMAMLIAWQTLNKVSQPARPALRQPVPRRHARHHHPRPPPCAAAERPGQLLRPARPDPARPAWATRQGADPDHQLPRLPAQGRARDQGRVQHDSQDPDPGRERPVQGDRAGDGGPSPARLGCGSGRRQSRSSVINDEAHHCYGTSRSTLEEDAEAEDSEAKERNLEARASGSTGIQAIAQVVGVKQVYDLSATPFYLGGSGYNRGLHLPVGGQRLLADGRHRVRHRQGAPHPGGRRRRRHEAVTYLQPVGSGRQAAAQEGRESKDSTARWVPPTSSDGALRSLYRSYERAFAHWEKELQPHGRHPQCSSWSAPTP